MPMRILQIHNAYGLPGGEDTIVETEAAMLEADGHVVRRLRAQNPRNGLGAVTTLARAVRNNGAAKAIDEEVRSARPDVAHVHNTWFSLSPEVFHRLNAFGVPVVMTLQNYRLLCANAQLFRSGRVCTDCVGRSPWRGVAYRCYRGSGPQSAVAAATIFVARRRGTFDLVDRFLAPSHFVKDLFVGAGLEPGRVVVRPNVVADPGRRPNPPSEGRTFLYAGRMSPEKGLPTLLEGWRRSRLAEQGFTLNIIGDGPLRQSLENQARTGVQFTGWQPIDQLRTDMLAARALLFPSEWYENFGRVIIEAMAAGLPVLASDMATPAELVGPLGSDWLVAPGDAAAWGRALARLGDRDRIDVAGARARQLYEGHFTLERGLQSLLAAYRAATADL